MKSIRLLVLSISVFSSVAFAGPDPDSTAQAAKSVNDFAVAHHRLVPAGNALVSPWSIQCCLAMVYAGAAGDTHDAMQKAFFFPADDTVMHAGFQSLRQALLDEPGADARLNVRVGNRVYHDQSVKLQPAFAEITRVNYSAEAGAVDFLHDAAGAETLINQWVSDQTLQKIPDIIPAGALKSTTRVVLVNAVYFDLPWEERFTKELTQDQPFRLNPTESKTVPLMFKQHRLGYAKKDGFQIAALPYAGGAFQFVVFLPDAVDELPKVEKSLNAKLLFECAKLPLEEVRLSLPRIKMAPPIMPLTGSLRMMGAGEMFIPTANFSRMVEKRIPSEPVFVSDVWHRTFLDLDEDGTKAAAATAAGLRIATNGHPHAVPHKVVKADHPFLFMIQHVPTGACLFLGRMTDPAPEATAVRSSPAPSQR